MTDMFGWDPYEEIMDLKSKNYKLKEIVNRLNLDAIKRDQTIREIIDQSNLHTDMLNKLINNVENLHNRVRLLEVARQYDTNNNQNQEHDRINIDGQQKV